MAQILISTIDPKNGSVNAVISIKDEYLQRIYDAYKHDYASLYIKQKIERGEVLEASDTVEHVRQCIDAKEILDDLLNNLVNIMVNRAHHVEKSIALEKFSSEMDTITWQA